MTKSITIPNEGSEIQVNIAQLYITRTYGKMLAGDPRLPEINQPIIDSDFEPKHLNDYPKLQLNHPPADEILPSHTLTMYLTSEVTITDEYAHGSHLVVRIFLDFDFNKSLMSQIESYIKKIDWMSVAEDFYY
jgi:hypothetical protein